MAIELKDEVTFNGTITNTASEQLEVQTATADYVQVMIDDGTTGGTPPTYDITQDYYQPAFDDYMTYAVETGQTATSIRANARGAKLRFTLTNSSGADDDYRIVIQSFEEI